MISRVLAVLLVSGGGGADVVHDPHRVVGQAIAGALLHPRRRRLVQAGASGPREVLVRHLADEVVRERHLVASGARSATPCRSGAATASSAAVASTPCIAANSAAANGWSATAPANSIARSSGASRSRRAEINERVECGIDPLQPCWRSMRANWIAYNGLPDDRARTSACCASVTGSSASRWSSNTSVSASSSPRKVNVRLSVPTHWNARSGRSGLAVERTSSGRSRSCVKQSVSNVSNAGSARCTSSSTMTVAPCRAVAAR